MASTFRDYDAERLFSEAQRQVEYAAASTEAARKLAEQNHRLRLITAGRNFGHINGAAAAIISRNESTGTIGGFQDKDCR